MRELWPGRVRPAAVAGQFYPRGAEELRSTVTTYLGRAKECAETFPKAVIAPHAGYVYSGPIAGTAFAALRAGAGAVRRVVLLGPAHYKGFAGIGIPSASGFATPLGEVPVDRAALEILRAIPGVQVEDEAHEPEHALEVEIPFVQCVFSGFTLVPLLVGEADAELAAEVLEAVWGGPETRVVISSDLSHYLDYDAARVMDEATAAAIVGLQPDALRAGCACGRTAIQGLLSVARARRLAVWTLDLRNSGDTAGTRDRVVGYGAFVVGRQDSSVERGGSG